MPRSRPPCVAPSPKEYSLFAEGRLLTNTAIALPRRGHAIGFARNCRRSIDLLRRRRKIIESIWSVGIRLTLNEAKTSLKNARLESFDFLGYTLGPQRYRKDGHWYLGASPSKKSVQRIKDRIGASLKPSDKGAWPKVRDKLNRLLVGWSSYFGFGTRLQAYRAVDNHVYDRVRHFLVQRHKVQGRGTRRFSRDEVYGELGVLLLKRKHLGPPPGALRRSRAESRMREIRTSGLMSGEGKRGDWLSLMPPRLSSTLLAAELEAGERGAMR